MSRPVAAKAFDSEIMLDSPTTANKIEEVMN